ncbi:MAG: PQQ-dependent sugar dehydrogenase [Acidimicrobiia bacterium]|nr:PQQ-dependent sugar dehydrogenase [Acidimicrobiia bacterium]
MPSNRIPPLPSEPILLETIDYTIRVVPLASGLERPWSIAFLPDGNILVTEITGKLRIVRPTGLDPRPIAGVPDVRVAPYEGLHDVVLHPRFPENRWLYLSYTKPGPDGTKALAISRGRFDGTALTNVEDIFVAQPWLGPKSGPSLGSRLAFDRDGLLYMAAASPAGAWQRAQDPNDHAGKVLRLRDDGSVPPDNPFVGRQGHRPEIYTMGHRSPLGLAMHPDTGEMFENENGPQGGDEINVLKPGGNYGWPVVSEGRDYGGRGYPTHVSVPGMEPPLMIWIPAIAISGMTFYTADAPFPRWKGNLFVGSLAYAHLERLTFNAKGEPSARDSRAREWLLLDLKQRIRDVRQGPDGLLYVVTDAMDGHLLRIEPAR